MKKAIMITMTLIISFVFVACSNAQPNSKAAVSGSKAEDLEFFCVNLEQKHKNLYAKISKEIFLKEKQKITDELPDMSDSEFYYSLKHLLSLVGDAHTNLSYNNSSYQHLNGLAFAVMKFSDGWHLMMLEEQNQAYLGYRLIAINDTKIEDVFEKTKTIISYENEAWAESLFSNTINFREALEYLNIVKKDDSITLQIQKDNDSTVETLEIKSMNEKEITSASIIKLNPQNPVATSPQDIYRAMQLNETTYYIQYNSCKEDAALPMSKFVETVSKEINAMTYKKVIIDLRYNTGGDSSILEPMFNELKDLKEKLNFEVYTLIGSQTFSSAIINSIQSKDQLDSKLVGSQTGGNVNGYGEIQSFDLQNTPITVRYSTNYFELIPNYTKDSLYPDIEIDQSFEHYLQGIDSEVQNVLNLK